MTRRTERSEPHLSQQGDASQGATIQDGIIPSQVAAGNGVAFVRFVFHPNPFLEVIVGKGRVEDPMTVLFEEGWLFTARSTVPALQQSHIPVQLQTGTQNPYQGNQVTISTVHSFKGYEAEMVFLVGADQFAAGSKALSLASYVGMTRARSLLTVTGLHWPWSQASREIVSALKACDGIQRST